MRTVEHGMFGQALHMHPLVAADSYLQALLVLMQQVRDVLVVDFQVAACAVVLHTCSLMHPLSLFDLLHIPITFPARKLPDPHFRQICWNMNSGIHRLISSVSTTLQRLEQMCMSCTVAWSSVELTREISTGTSSITQITGSRQCCTGTGKTS